MDDRGLDGADELTILSRSELADRVRQRTADLENLMDTMVDVLVKLGPDGRIRMANEAVREMLGYDPDELVGKPIDYVLAESSDDVELASMLHSGELIEHLLREGSVTDLESYLETKDGEAVPTSLSASVMTDDAGSVEGIVCVATDTTERTEAKERAEFLHSVLRHDLGNKLTVIDGYLELLAETDLTDQQREYLSYADNGVTEAIDLVENVRTLHQLDADEELSSISLSRVISETVDRHADLASQHDFDVETDVDELHVTGGTLLKELFANLLENALVHSGGSQIRIRTTATDDAVTVFVEDDGDGIAPADRERIFDRGVAIGESGGTGLGTHLAAEIATSYGGELTVDDSSLGGAQFCVHLKRAN
ncbi:PAS/PAC sensor signal transduction histidine kinase [Halovivax asiaticus JCM 14624]|uniref:histidine kinase n=1 Tax=Halovivax asiaticus JCM 14624 TaxID=1227490 RepID=M0BMV7_9EURY|nr:PAS domain-containing sensor histidine kinase [Halovivax asiaticus]ELZ11623.1 PAS/PAC sensor signal transduction histidine kinase [Halovivax asiaticus JCM 14624]